MDREIYHDGLILLLKMEQVLFNRFKVTDLIENKIRKIIVMLQMMEHLNFIMIMLKIFQTTGIGITVGLSTIQHNGNAAFAGITTIGTLLDVNGRIDGK